jgi:hypothetical protein
VHSFAQLLAKCRRRDLGMAPLPVLDLAPGSMFCTLWTFPTLPTSLRPSTAAPWACWELPCVLSLGQARSMEVNSCFTSKTQPRCCPPGPGQQLPCLAWSHHLSSAEPFATRRFVGFFAFVLFGSTGL